MSAWAREAVVEDLRAQLSSRRYSNLLSEGILDGMNANGLTAPTISHEYGGNGYSYLELVEWCRLVGSLNSAARALVTVQSIAAETINRWGSAAQKEHWLPRLASGQTVCAFAASEENAGSNLALIQTRLLRRQGTWILTGAKSWVTFGQRADAALVLASSETGPTLVVTPLHDGVRRVARHSGLGLRNAGLADLVFDNVQVAEESVFSGIGLALSMHVQTALDVGRLCVSAGAAGIIDAALEETLSHASSRLVKGGVLLEHQLIQRQIAQVVTHQTATTALVREAANCLDRARSDSRLRIWVAKYYAARAALESAQINLEVKASQGVDESSRTIELLNEAHLLPIIEGTQESCEMMISRLMAAERIRRPSD